MKGSTRVTMATLNTVNTGTLALAPVSEVVACNKNKTGKACNSKNFD